MTVASPCVGICRLGADAICVGCERSVEEIARWSVSDDIERLRALAAIEIRRKARQRIAMSELRIVSFLPSATEMACVLGLEDFIVGVSHECDFPPSIRAKPVVVHSAIPVKEMTLGEIDVAVAAQLKSGGSLYEVDLDLLRQLRPTHILTQDLCQVCAPAGNEVTRALNALPDRPEILWMSPHSIADIHNDLRNLARMAACERRAEELVHSNEARLGLVRKTVEGAPIHRVFCAEWIDPIYCCGHWVPEQLEVAGGFDRLGRKWKDSVRVPIDDVTSADPEIIIVMPCGFGLHDAMNQAREFALKYPDLRAVKNGELYAVDASYFSRPSLRVIDGVELLAHILHSDRFEWHGASDAFARIGKAPTTKICPECGAAFTCGSSENQFNCWCAELPHLPRAQFNNEGCLCRGCLLQKLAIK